MTNDTNTKPKSLVSLYTESAIAADAAFSRVLADAGMDRWETPRDRWTDAVREAYRRKVQADDHMHQAWQLWRNGGAS